MSKAGPFLSQYPTTTANTIYYRWCYRYYDMEGNHVMTEWL